MLSVIISQIAPTIYNCLFFFNDTATTEIYTLSLHDALPICGKKPAAAVRGPVIMLPSKRTTGRATCLLGSRSTARRDRKSTRLNSSHDQISYAVFCLKKKNLPRLCRQVTDGSGLDSCDRAHA